MTFYVGQKVVCVDATENCHLVTGAIYTITKIDPLGFLRDVEIWLAEARHPSGTGFYMARFRPLVERKTDISIFTKMLNPSHERVDA